MSRTTGKIAAACIVAFSIVAGPGTAQAALVSITGGTATSIAAGNNVLAPAGIAQQGGSIHADGTLLLLGDGLTLTLHDAGSESSWRNVVRLGNTAGSALFDADDFAGGLGGRHDPWQQVGSVTQNAGTADLQFFRVGPPRAAFLVANGGSPRQIASLSFASLAFAYLSDGNQIVSGATNRILVLLDDSGAGPDRDYDDYVGVLTVTPVPLPAAWLLLGSAIAFGGGMLRRRPL